MLEKSAQANQYNYTRLTFLRSHGVARPQMELLTRSSKHKAFTDADMKKNGPLFQYEAAILAKAMAPQHAAYTDMPYPGWRGHEDSKGTQHYVKPPETRGPVMCTMTALFPIGLLFDLWIVRDAQGRAVPFYKAVELGVLVVAEGRERAVLSDTSSYKIMGKGWTVTYRRQFIPEFVTVVWDQWTAHGWAANTTVFDLMGMFMMTGKKKHPGERLSSLGHFRQLSCSGSGGRLSAPQEQKGNSLVGCVPAGRSNKKDIVVAE